MEMNYILKLRPKSWHLHDLHTGRFLNYEFEFKEILSQWQWEDYSFRRTACQGIYDWMVSLKVVLIFNLFSISLKGGRKNTLKIYMQINEVRRSIGSLSGKLAIYCSDASIARYLRARNWNVKKAIKMLKGSLKWRAEYKPEEIRWVQYFNVITWVKIQKFDSGYFWFWRFINWIVQHVITWVRSPYAGASMQTNL